MKLNVLVTVLVLMVELKKSNGHDSCSKTENQYKLFKKYPPDETLNQYNQEDENLIEIVRQRIVPPAMKCQEYNLTRPEVNLQYLPEVGILEEQIFRQKTAGFFIEVGAYDGESLSVSLYYERFKDWSGLLIEAQPNHYQKILTKNRKSKLLGQCLSTKRTPEIVSFDASGPYGGIINNNKWPGGSFNGDHRNEHFYRRSKLTLQCFPFFTILMALGNPVVDLFILDIEGAEIPVLKTIPWDKVNIKVIIVEVNHLEKIFDGSKEDLENMMTKNGYILFKNMDINFIYVKKDLILEQ